MNCTIKLNEKVFNDSKIAGNFSCARTKCSVIVSNLIAPDCLKQLKVQLETVNFLSASTDASNHGNIEIFPLVVQFFSLSMGGGGMQTKLIDIQELPNETSDTIDNYILQLLKKNNLSKKCIAFGGDNANVNFGGLERSGSNNVYSKLKKELGYNIFGSDCSCHIIHNASKSVSDILKLDVDVFVQKVFSHSSIYIVRVQNLIRVF